MAESERNVGLDAAARPDPAALAPDRALRGARRMPGLRPAGQFGQPSNSSVDPSVALHCP